MCMGHVQCVWDISCMHGHVQYMGHVQCVGNIDQDMEPKTVYPYILSCLYFRKNVVIFYVTPIIPYAHLIVDCTPSFIHLQTHHFSVNSACR